jgi:ribonuclease BN (tRNA processing enzyme)
MPAKVKRPVTAKSNEPSPSMTLTVLGSGSAFSRLYGTTCSLLRLRDGRAWLIDCGRQAPDQLWARGLTWWDIDGQIITHVHGDHAYGLEDFALMRYYGGANVGRSVLSGGAKPTLVAHSAVLAEIWEFLAPSLRYRGDENARTTTGGLQDYFTVLEPGTLEKPRGASWNHSETFRTPGLELTVRETQHVPTKPSTALEIVVDGEGDRIAWWGGDSIVDADRLVELEPRTVVFFHDCTFTEHPGIVHAAFSHLKKLPRRVREKIVLMHHDDNLADHRAAALEQGFRLLLPGVVVDLETGCFVSEAAAAARGG